MLDPALIRSLGLFLPLTAAWLLWLWRRPGPRLRAAVLLACAWNVPALFALHLLAQLQGWWRFEAVGGLILGYPVDLYIGWILLWGAVPVLACGAQRPIQAALLMLALDVLLLLVARPVIVLGDNWLLGEAVGFAACLVPGLLLAHWTAADVQLAARATLQFVGFTTISFWLVPTAVLAATNGSWQLLVDRLATHGLFVLVPFALPALLGLSAFQEFVVRGRGTPVPYDPPRKLVTSGPYAYLANPMQLAASLMLALLGVMLGSAWLVAVAFVAWCFSAGLAAWEEDGALRRRFSADWVAYRRAVRNWLPHWRPWHVSMVPTGDVSIDSGAVVSKPPTPHRPPARLYVAEGCDPCSDLGGWLAAHAPVGLVILPAEDQPARDLWRITYDPADGSPEVAGMAAVSRALEHIHLGWAFVGWVIRLPMIGAFVQLVADAVGGEARRVPRSVGRGTGGVAESLGHADRLLQSTRCEPRR